MSDTLTHKGLTFSLQIERDDFLREPWKEHDGHGPVSDWRPLDSKRAGERVLYQERGGRALFYDWAQAMRDAKRDGWGLTEQDKAKLAARLKREPTAGEIREAAVLQDFEHLRDWCEDRWCWVCVKMTLLDIDGNPTSEYETRSGIESDADEYLNEVARELADEIAARVGDDETYTVTVPARSTTYKIREE